MRVIAFTGMPGSGKSEAVDVARARQAPVLNMGDFVREETRRRGLDLTDANVGQVASRMRQEHGAGVWAERTMQRIREAHADAPLVVVDGVRNHEEVETFRGRLGDRFTLIAITAPPEARLARLRERGRSDDPEKDEDFRRRDERELGWGIAKSIALADHAVVNEGDLNGFRTAVRDLLDRLAA